MIFVYEKIDDAETQTGKLQIVHTIYIDQTRTADFQTTTGLLKLLENDANIDDIVAFMYDRFLPLDETQANQLAEEVQQSPPTIGYLTISNALQWRLQYRRVIQEAGSVSGIVRVV
ncbi:MAG: type II restriction endonuclease [Chloroflexota bacterium]